jgi:hypothetical protein
MPQPEALHCKTVPTTPRLCTKFGTIPAQPTNILTPKQSPSLGRLFTQKIAATRGVPWPNTTRLGPATRGTRGEVACLIPGMKRPSCMHMQHRHRTPSQVLCQKLRTCYSVLRHAYPSALPYDPCSAALMTYVQAYLPSCHTETAKYWQHPFPAYLHNPGTSNRQCKGILQDNLPHAPISPKIIPQLPILLHANTSRYAPRRFGTRQPPLLPTRHLPQLQLLTPQTVTCIVHFAQHTSHAYVWWHTFLTAHRSQHTAAAHLQIRLQDPRRLLLAPATA